ncbi:MAG: hypothetical protein FJW39_03900 [Acidobacteria bacterium]|nr:hypothetical protein [Acidobacteriota bacterium]
MEELRVMAEEGFQKIPHGGIEVGALLFGNHDQDAVRVLEWRPIQCEHARGPGFVLSPKDLTGMEALLATCASAPELRGLEPVGWFHTHTRSKIFLSAEDLKIHERFFPEPWQISLVMRLSKENGASAGFFVREEGGAIRAESSLHEFPVAPDPAALTAPTRMTALRKGPQRRDRRRPAQAGSSAPAPTLVPPPGRIPQREPVAAPPEPADLPPVPEPPGFPWKTIAVFAALIAVPAGLLWYLLGTSAPSGPVPAALRVEEVASELAITWDRNLPAVRKATRGNIYIADGAAKRSLDLDQDDVREGSVVYRRQAENVEVRIEMFLGDVMTVRDIKRFVGQPVKKPAPVPEPKPAAEVSPELQEEIDRLRRAISDENADRQNLDLQIRRADAQLKRGPNVRK